MRRILLLTISILLIPSLFSATAAPQQPEQSNLPNPADYPAAGPTCQNRVKLSPWVGTPGVDWPKTFRCVLSIHTCDGVKTYTSGVRPAGTGMCADYWSAHDALVNREVCCDQGSREEKRPPQGTRPPDAKCPPPTPWFDRSSGCKEVKSPQLVISGGTATLYICGYPVFSHTDTNLRDQLFANAYRAAMRDQIRASGFNKVCCDTFRNAARTGKPCDPRADLDCDGQPNKSDADEFGVPDIDTFTRPDGAAIDKFPEYFDKGNPDFLPNRTARNSKGVGDCPCKWELVRGELKCSPDGKQRHYYKATWRCPKTRAEVFTVRYAPATAPCEK